MVAIRTHEGEVKKAGLPQHRSCQLHGNKEGRQKIDAPVGEGGMDMARPQDTGGKYLPYQHQINRIDGMAREANI